MNVWSWLRLLRKSAGGWRKDLPDLTLQGTNGTSGRLYGPTCRQDEVFGSSAGPFVSKVHEASQWARNFAICACSRLFQHGVTRGSGGAILDRVLLSLI
jgi:hypothetical protein